MSNRPIVVETPYRQISPYESDGGHLIGRDPREVPLADIHALGHPQKPMAAIRSYCIECCCGQEREVRKCVMSSCSLWPLRMGSNPYRAKSSRVMTDEERDNARRRLKDLHAKRKAASPT